MLRLHLHLSITLLLLLPACASLPANRTALLQSASAGMPQRYFQRKLGPPDLVLTLPQLLDRVPDRAGDFFVPVTGRTLEFYSYRGLTSFYLWRAIYPTASVNEFSDDWMDDYPYRGFRFWFYDAKPPSDPARNSGGTSQCHAFAFDAGICVAAFTFPWNPSALSP